MFGGNQAHKYRLKVTAGAEYNPDTHKIVPVNRDQTLRIENDLATVSLCVRIQNYTGEHHRNVSPTPGEINAHGKETRLS
jgi:hypothetical protein